MPEQRGTKAEILQCISLKTPDVLDKSTVAQIAQQLSKNFKTLPSKYSLLPQPPDNQKLNKSLQATRPTLKSMIVQTMTQMKSDHVTIDAIIDQLLSHYGKD